MEKPKIPSGEEYEPGIQVAKAKKEGTATKETIVKNILGQIINGGK